MKETRQLSIGGYAFVLETDAAEELQRYMGDMEKHYLPQEGGKEILEGIEERIAELFLDKKLNVISLANVQEVIAVIGRPEKIEAEEPETSGSDAPKSQKRLYRDLENKQVAGVCSGLAAYLNIDVAIMRLIWAVAAIVVFASGGRTGTWSLLIPFIYFVLWAAMPAARTAQDRWAMKGDGGTIKDIRRNVESGLKEMGETAKGVAAEAGSSETVKGIGRALAVLIGLILLVVGVAGLASSSVVALKGMDMFGVQIGEWIDDELPGLLTFASEPLAVVLVAVAVLLPFLGLLYGGLQLIFGFKSPSWRPGLWIFVLWLIDLVVLMVLGFAGMLAWF